MCVFMDIGETLRALIFLNQVKKKKEKIEKAFNFLTSSS